MPTQTSPVHTRDDAALYTFLGEVLAVRLSAEQTGGSVGVIEHLLPRGTATPLHVHAAESELFHVLEGRITVWIEGQLSSAEAGDVVWLPGGARHAFRVDSERAHLLALSLPGGHERFFALAGEPADAFELAAPSTQPPDMARMAAAAAQTGVEILGPPPFEDA